MTAAETSPPIMPDIAELRRGLHDNVLQLLEFLSTGGYGQLAEPSQYQRCARDAASALRRLLDGNPVTGSLVDAVRGLARAALRPDPTVTIRVLADDACCATPAEVCTPLIGAVRESICNALRHSGASTVDVSCARDAQCVTVSIDDDGCGWHPDAVAGFGVTHSIFGRMIDAGGSATVVASDRGGVRVALYQPLAV
ncbi:MAG: nreB 1 [Thermoleophilia bacterium]|nr:nreB 1 [Thermoleophilia bacterium]